MSELAPILSTGVGSWPGTDMADAIKIALAECPELSYLPELPARGAHAQLVGRSTALLTGLAVDLQPAGWRLTDGSGREHRLARSTLRTDLDLLEEHAQGYRGRLKLSAAGPWTLAALMERPRGDRVLADSGARRDLAQSLTEGVLELVGDLIRRLPEVDFVLQLDEPLLPAVLAGTVPTASGFSRHRVVDRPEVGGTFAAVVARLTPLEVPLWVHSCAPEVPIPLLQDAGVALVSLDLDLATTRTWDQIGSGLSRGLWLGAGVLPTNRLLSADEVAHRVLGPLRRLGLDPAVAGQVVLSPTCGLAGATRDQAVQSLRVLRTAAAIVTEQLAE